MKSLITAFVALLMWFPPQPSGQPSASEPPRSTPAAQSDKPSEKASQQPGPNDSAGVQAPNCADPKLSAVPAAKHAYTAMDGFELDAKAAADNARSVGKAHGPTVFLYAPSLTKLYSLNPTFYWASEVKTKAFVFRLYDAEGEVGYEARTPGCSLQYPADATPLLPGQNYVWNVLAGLGLLGGGSFPAKFTVLAAEERAALDKQLSGADPAKRAAIFSDNRLWYDAIQAYTELIAAHPNQSDLYEKRGQIYDQLPATHDLAQADFAKADDLRTKK